ncbi:hypothetical protein [Rubritalea sp.]|uniref:hypothetical protein n=1 Tax=Rubritalea sp. TaxID=2109375 RepID=UPI003242968B
MILIFVAIGYVAHPIVLPFVEDKLPKPQVVQSGEVDELLTAEEVPVAKIEPLVTVLDEAEDASVSPRIVEEATEPESMLNGVVEDVEVEVTERDEMSEAQVVAAMQKSIKAGEVNEFGYDEVVAWEFAGDEGYDGSTYQVGLVFVRMTTIFGLSEQKVKALCEDGAVVKWLWAASGVEIE